MVISVTIFGYRNHLTTQGDKSKIKALPHSVCLQLRN